MLRRSTLSGEPPDSWGFKDSLTFLHPDGVANVIFSGEPDSSGETPEEIARRVHDGLLSTLDGYELHALEPAVVFGEHAGFMHRFSWTTDSEQRATQIQMYAVADGTSYIATASSHSETFPNEEPGLVEILLGLRIGDDRGAV